MVYSQKMHGTCTMVAILYLSYLAYLLVQVVNDELSIETSYEYLDKLSIPNIEICGDWSDIEVSKCVFTQNDGITTFDGCNEFLTRKSKNDNTYCYLYTTNDTYFYGNEEKNPNVPSVRNIDFYFKIKDIPTVTSHYLSVGTVTVQITDPICSMSTDLRIKQELQLMNGIAGIQDVSTVVTFKKKTLRTISPYDIFAILGVNPNYHSTHYLTSVSKNFPMHSDESFTDTGHFSIAPGTFIHKVKSEKRSHTILGALESAGCAFVAIGGIYFMLIRRSRGFSCNRFAKPLENNAELQNLTCVSAQDEKVSTEQRVKQLENKIQELETILGNQSK